MPLYCAFLLALLLLPVGQLASQHHDHPAPEQLGVVTFANSCAAGVQPQFERGVALLHSFAYAAARVAFGQVAAKDPRCAMAHWGIAMTYYHQLWEPPLYASDLALGRQEIERALEMAAGTERERGFIEALALIYRNAEHTPYRDRVVDYRQAMSALAAGNPQDAETQIFYALALLAAAPPEDKTHANQKRAAAILDPLYRRYPLHPGIAHYLIHACDNAEMASRGIAAARAYARIAPSAPHALHMPSHIFTRLGMWEDSVRSNRAAQAAARQQGDIGEALHAMDYLVYAYLQMGRVNQAAQVIRQLDSIPALNAADFKVAYAATAMPVRFALERRRWADAAASTAPKGAPPQVAAIAVWARAVGLARSGRAAEARPEIDRLREIARQLDAAGDQYWASQVEIQAKEAAAWTAAADGSSGEAASLLREAADREDAVEKLPLTPGPIIPAREQLGELLLEKGQPKLALEAFQTALVGAPGRRGSLVGASRAARLAGEPKRAEFFRSELRRLAIERRD
ncbi:MAG TPA: hypothetical protein VGS20_10080 [Candidatus Acidoferrales bacterium]|nr:hypothetical protein [Candidatus Acidoferrales bacterium]